MRTEKKITHNDNVINGAIIITKNLTLTMDGSNLKTFVFPEPQRNYRKFFTHEYERSFI
jgi:hypothetical protein